MNDVFNFEDILSAASYFEYARKIGVETERGLNWFGKIPYNKG
jgi:hypothetical protein